MLSPDMKNQQAETLYKKYLAGNCTPEERAIVEAWYVNEIYKREKDQLEVDDESVKAEMWAMLEKRTNTDIPLKGISRRWYPYAAAAAVILVAFGTSLFLYLDKPNPVVQQVKITKPVIDDKNAATLTLDNGEKIILSDAVNGDLARQTGVVIRKNAAGQIIYDMQSPPSFTGKDMVAKNNTEPRNVLTTKRGQQYQLVLPDGSKVWLNAESSLHFPTLFKGSERRVELIGEGYFEIAKNKTKPFIVKIKDVNIEVLGTHFNVSSYPDEKQIKTTLLEGSVKVATGNAQDVLVPGEQAIVNQRNKIEVSQADIEEATAWKDGYFKFNKQDIRYIMRQLARWYDIEVVYEGDVSEDLYIGKIRRSENISEMLKVLELNQIRYEIKGKKITIKF
jgi:transmembrane sensor